MLGHIFPVFYGFHGGKGVLLAATTLLAIDPLTCALSVGVLHSACGIHKVCFGRLDLRGDILSDIYIYPAELYYQIS